MNLHIVNEFYDIVLCFTPRTSEHRHQLGKQKHNKPQLPSQQCKPPSKQTTTSFPTMQTTFQTMQTTLQTTHNLHSQQHKPRLPS